MHFPFIDGGGERFNVKPSREQLVCTVTKSSAYCLGERASLHRRHVLRGEQRPRVGGAGVQRCQATGAVAHPVARL